MSSNNIKKQNKNKEISVTDFKAKCLRFFKLSQKKGTKFTVTNKGIPIAVVLPFKSGLQKQPLFGTLKGQIKVTGDLVYFDTSDLWDALK